MRRMLLVATAVVVCPIFSRSGQTVRVPVAPSMSQLEHGLSDKVLEPQFLQLFPESIRSDPRGLARCLEVSSSVHVLDGYDFGSGLEPKDQGHYECAWTINRRDHNAAVVMMETLSAPGVRNDWTEFHTFGATWRALPSPLASWGKARGMKVDNTFIHFEPKGQNRLGIDAFTAGVGVLFAKQPAPH